MNIKLNNIYKKARNEKGSSELPVTLIVLPFILFMIFALIDVGFYFNTRSQVQNVLNQGVREMALYGGNSASNPLNTTGKTVQQNITDRLYNSSTRRCVISQCAPLLTNQSPTSTNFAQRRPTVSCTPSRTTRVGQPVSCTVTYTYHPVVRDMLFGFTQFITSPSFTVKATSISEVGQ
jgi:Flp pilus assembly protein TadG